jgi:type II secretory pathway component PulF
MPSFRYSALDGTGKAVRGEIDAPARADAIARLAEQDVYVTKLDCEDAGAAAAPARRFGLPLRRRVSLRSKAAMLRQLATALQAGLPLLSALRVVAQQAESDAMRTLASDLAERVQAGQSLSEAMGAHPREFSRLEASMVRVGETAGVLEEVMGHLTEFAERDVDIREKIRSAATYPVFVLALACVSVVLVVALILPSVIETVTESVGEAVLPAPTRALLGFSELVRAYWWALLAGAAAAIWAFRAWLARPRGRLAWDRLKLRTPVLGRTIRRIAVARFARTLGTLSKSGIQILDALGVLRGTLGNEVLARKIDDVAASITQGQSIAEPLRKTGEFPPLLIQVIAMGERTGRLDELLLQTAEAYEKDTTAAVQRVMTILPAILIVLLAVVVAFVLAAVLLPVVEMGTSLPEM